MSRSRSAVTPGIPGSYVRRYNGVNYPVTSSVPNAYEAQCTDVESGFGKNNSFFLRARGCQGARGNGQRGTNSTGGVYYYTDTPSTRCVMPTFLTFPAAAVYLNCRAALLGRTGNAAPSFNLPVSVLELKDLPRMLKHAGDLLHGLRNPSGLNPLREGAAATLAYQFGWRPLIDDLKKTLSFQAIVEKRRSAINRSVDSDSGVDRSTTIEDRTWEVVDTVIDKLPGTGNTSIKRTRTYTRKTEGYVTWTPKERIRSLGDDALNREAFRSALGLSAKNIPLATWKLLPWSWLIDWFANCSELLSAHQNMVDYKPTRGGITMYARDDYHHSGYRWTTQGGLEVSPYEAYTEYKTRYPITTWAGLTPRMNLPFLDGFKTSVLGSLAILKIAKP